MDIHSSVTEVSQQVIKEVEALDRKITVVASSAERPYIEVRVQQNDKEGSWAKLRHGPAPFMARLGSSDVGTVASINRYSTAQQLFVKRFMQKPFTGNDATEHGHKAEDLVASYFRQRTFQEDARSVGYMIPDPNLNPNFNQRNDHLRFGASLDLINPIAELKAPVSSASFSKNYIMHGRFMIPPQYLAQMHLQMAVMNVQKMYFVVCVFEMTDQRFKELTRAVVAQVYFEPRFWKFIYERCSLFSEVLSQANEAAERNGRDPRVLAKILEQVDFDKKQQFRIANANEELRTAGIAIDTRVLHDDSSLEISRVFGGRVFMNSTFGLAPDWRTVVSGADLETSVLFERGVASAITPQTF